MSTWHSFAVILHHTPCIYIAPMAMLSNMPLVDYKQYRLICNIKSHYMHKTLALTPFIDAGWSSLSPSPLDFERNPDDFSCELPLASGFAWECDRVDGAVIGLSIGAVAVVGLVTAVAGRCFALWWAELGRLDAALDSTSASVSAILHASWQKQKQKVSQYHSLKM